MRRLLSLLLATLLASVASAADAPPRLVVWITVDQLRGDFPLRLEQRLCPSGIRRLMSGGVYYTNAHYDHANTLTAVGHATLFTGAHSAEHGMAGNDWFDRETGDRVYCVEDASHPLLGQETEPHAGTSPRNLTSSTVGDELRLATGGRAKVFSVSIKDRGAILPGGHLGKAFWYSSSTGEFVTSDYYYESEPPAWLGEWNAAKPADRYLGSAWTLLAEPASYVNGADDDRAVEKGYGSLGTSFPHELPAEAGKAFYKALRYVPFGDRLTAELAKTVVAEEALGADEVTDLLAVSFSVTDYVGHAWGPNSLEYEDQVLQVDATIADLLEFVDECVGLDRCLVVLASDHGVGPIPEHAQAHGFDADRLRHVGFLAAVNERLRERFQTGETLAVAFWNPGVYLDRAAVRRAGLDVELVERALAEALLAQPGIAQAFPRTDLLRGALPDTPLAQRVQLAFHPKRSGDVLIVQEPFWYLYPEADAHAAMHGSPHAYDTYVPVLLMRPGLAPRRVSRPIAPCDVAATVSAYLGISPPSGCVGRPLEEVLEGAELR